jgi:hypothetical protein
LLSSLAATDERYNYYVYLASATKTDSFTYIASNDIVGD